jgi:hypothetical protein
MDHERCNCLPMATGSSSAASFAEGLGNRDDDGKAIIGDVRVADKRPG